VPGKSYVCSKNGSPKSNSGGTVGLGVPIDPYVAQTQSWGAEKTTWGIRFEQSNRMSLKIAVDLHRDSTRSCSHRGEV